MHNRGGPRAFGPWAADSVRMRPEVACETRAYGPLPLAGRAGGGTGPSCACGVLNFVRHSDPFPSQTGRKRARNRTEIRDIDIRQPIRNNGGRDQRSKCRVPSGRLPGEAGRDQERQRCGDRRQQSTGASGDPDIGILASGHVRVFGIFYLCFCGVRSGRRHRGRCFVVFRSSRHRSGRRLRDDIADPVFRTHLW